MYWNDNLVLMSTELTFELMEPYIFVLLHFSACVYAQWHPTFCDPVDCSPPGSSVRGITQARILRVGCHFFLQGSFLTQGLNPVSCIGRRILYHCSCTLWPKSEKIPRYRKESSLCEWTVKEKMHWKRIRSSMGFILPSGWQAPKGPCTPSVEPIQALYLPCGQGIPMTTNISVLQLRGRPFLRQSLGESLQSHFLLFPLGPPCEWSFFNSKTFTRRQQWDCWGIFFLNTLAMPKWLAFFFFLFSLL